MIKLCEINGLLEVEGSGPERIALSPKWPRELIFQLLFSTAQGAPLRKEQVFR